MTRPASTPAVITAIDEIKAQITTDAPAAFEAACDLLGRVSRRDSRRYVKNLYPRTGYTRFDVEAVESLICDAFAATPSGYIPGTRR